MNWYNFFANVVTFVHALFLLTVVGGLLLILLGGLRGWQWVRNFWLRLVHGCMIGVVIVQAVLGIQCPLTTWEIKLRIAGDTPMTTYFDYEGEEWEYYAAQDSCGRCLQSLVFYSWPQWVFFAVYISVGVAVLLSLLCVRPRWPWRKPGEPVPLPVRNT